MTQDEKQEALYTIQALEDQTTHLFERAERLSYERHQLRLMQTGLIRLQKFVEAVEVDILLGDVPPTTWDRYVEGM